MFSKFKFQFWRIISLGIFISICHASPQSKYFQSGNQQSLQSFERSPTYNTESEFSSEYLNLLRQLQDNADLGAKQVPDLRTKFDPQSLRVSRLAVAPTRPPPLDPKEQMRLQQAYADRNIREQQRLVLGLGKARPKAPAPPELPKGTPIFKPFPIYYSKDPVSSYAPNVPDDDSYESDEQYQRSVPKKPLSFRPGPKKTYYDERFF